MITNTPQGLPYANFLNKSETIVMIIGNLGNQYTRFERIDSQRTLVSAM